MAKDNQQKCQNCGNEVENDYCSFCGQVYESKIKPIASFIRDFLGDIFALDSRAAITIKKLIFHPGFLTEEYLIGKRVQYVPPTRLYVLLSLLLLFLISINTNQNSTKLMIYPGFLEWYDGDEWAGNIGQITSYVKDSIIPVEADFMTTISRLAFILLPLIALIYKIMFFSKYYIEHIIHVIHIMSFIFFMFIIYEIIEFLPLVMIGEITSPLPEKISTMKTLMLNSENTYIILLIIIILPIYGLISIKKVYNNKWLLTIIKSSIIYFLTLILFLFTLIIYSHLYHLIINQLAPKAL